MRSVKMLAIAIFALVTISFAVDTRYKDRIFEVQKDSILIDSVPNFVADGNLGTLTTMLILGKAFGSYDDYIMYFYKKDTLENQGLWADIYTPAKDSDKSRPLILVLHGGAFVAAERNDIKQKTVAYCDSLAARGFVTASLGYRKGVIMQETEDPDDATKTLMTVDSASFASTVYRGVQDVRAAIRYFRKNASKYGIDTSKIYIMGNSAGAVLGLENIFAQDEDEYPDYIDIKDLGNLDEYGPRNYGSIANGLVSLWGGIHDPSLIVNNKVPVFLAHGDADETINFGAGRPLEHADESIRSKDKKGYFDNYNFAFHTPTLYGSKIIDSVLTANQVYHEGLFVHGVGHEFYDDTLTTADTTIVYEEMLRPRIFNFLYALATDSFDISKSASEIVIGIHAIANRIASGYTVDEHNLGFTLAQGKDVGYAVYNLQGRKVLGGKTSAGTHVDFRNLTSGVYTLFVKGSRGIRFSISK